MINKALEALKNGEIVLIFDNDNRERETDMIVAGEFMLILLRTSSPQTSSILSPYLRPSYFLVAEKNST